MQPVLLDLLAQLGLLVLPERLALQVNLDLQDLKAQQVFPALMARLERRALPERQDHRVQRALLESTVLPELLGLRDRKVQRGLLVLKEPQAFPVWMGSLELPDRPGPRVHKG